MGSNADYRSVDGVEFKSTKIHKINTFGHISKHPYRYALNLPDFLADWDVWDYWEKENVEHMRKVLHHNDKMIVVGAEHGYMAALYGLLINPRHIGLIEPSDDFWPNIKAVWEHNFANPPMFTYRGFAGARCSHNFSQFGLPEVNDWVQSAYSRRLTTTHPYRYLHTTEHSDSIPTITIDRMVEITKIIPDALAIDVEGAEMEVLTGAARTLRKYKPMAVWVAIHPDLMIKNHGTQSEELIGFMEELGYTHDHISTDHEEHHFFGA